MDIEDNEGLQKLLQLEAEIREEMESFVRTGLKLKEIRDNELWRHAKCKHWKDYCKTRANEVFGYDIRQVYNLIQAATIRLKLPNLENCLHYDANNEKEEPEAIAR